MERPAREARREQARAVAAADIGPLSAREILIAGAIAYWCEGAKRKPHNLSECIAFVNSDPRLIRFSLRFLREAGVEFSRLRYRVYIHETADVVAAEQYWRDITGADPAQFHKTVLKKHNPRTVRTNVGSDYHGCLVVKSCRARTYTGRSKAGPGLPWPTRHEPASWIPMAGFRTCFWWCRAPGEGFEPSLSESKSLVLPG